ncbi:polysaccharide deacetylase family protein [Halobacillus naozhouensis]|uniref:Polysaccharide deacetylase family protein n=1 Tax=Halobacillus naozhouensis TaxID=554880 RepID=A0ABY8J0P9_9BACI|nr:polysaccharide deacetylase family protein [Halobacillus naozhouensis]WFT74561.1 polysaccharide deacetylase family protein [Halobacillus naozhouensis]
MRRLNIYIALLSLLLILTACSIFIADANEGSVKVASDPASYYDVSMVSDIEEYEKYHITIHYPQTPNDQIDQVIIDYVNQKKDAFKKRSYEVVLTSEEQSVHELHIDFDVVYQNEKVFVVEFIETADVGQKQVDVSRTVMNFDKSSGKLLELKNLFKKDTNYKEVLAQEAKEELGTQNETGHTSVSIENTALTGSSLVVYLTNEDQKRWNTSTSKVSIDKHELNDILLPEYAQKVVQTAEKKKDKTSFPKIKKSDQAPERAVEKKVALTFDNGPHPKRTPLILDMLEKYDASATFFMIGKRLKHYPEAAREVVKQGHVIGNHTWDHPSFGRLSDSQREAQLDKTQQLIHEVTGVNTKIVRLPFGGKLSEAFKDQYRVIPWTINTTENWNLTNASEIAHAVISKVEDGSIIVLSSLHSVTPEALEIILEELTAQGYSFVPVSAL